MPIFGYHVLFFALCSLSTLFVVDARKHHRKLSKGDYSATAKNFRPSCPLKIPSSTKHRALIQQVDSDDLSQKTNKTTTSAAKMHSFFSATKDMKKLLSFDGPMCHNRIDYSEANLNKTLEHLNAEPISHDDVEKLFTFVRDWRGLPNGSQECNVTYDGLYAQPRSDRDDRTGCSQQSNFTRRLTWLYPLDSCFVRAEMVARLAEKVIAVKPRTIHKIWVYGTLAAVTPYSKEGYVAWGYHVAAIVRSEREGYMVLDAALDHEAPLPIDKWLGKMQHPREVCPVCSMDQFQITNRFSFVPSDNCDETQSVFDETAKASANRSEAAYYKNMHYMYLDAEWGHLKSLDMRPEVLL